MRREDLRRILDAVSRGTGSIGGALLAAVVILGPPCLMQMRGQGGAGSADPAARGVDRGRIVVRGELLESWASEGFAGLAASLEGEGAPAEPSWERLRRTMEEQRCTGLRYALRVRWTMDDGGQDDITYVRRPYHEPWHVPEFLRLLQKGPKITSDGSSDEPSRVLRIDPDAPALPIHLLLIDLLDAHAS